LSFFARLEQGDWITAASGSNVAEPESAAVRLLRARQTLARIMRCIRPIARLGSYKVSAGGMPWIRIKAG
jgi:hypothetical protein